MIPNCKYCNNPVDKPRVKYSPKRGACCSNCRRENRNKKYVAKYLR